MTQLELALDAGISARHLSFVETGRSKPGREMLLRVLEQLKVPFREQNRLLLAAGHAPAFPERSLEDPDLAPVRDALDVILSGHEPYPAVAVDRAWNLIAANSPMLALTESVEVDPALLEPPINVMRVGLHPRGLGAAVRQPRRLARALARATRPPARGNGRRAARRPDRGDRRLPRARARARSSSPRSPAARCSARSGCATPDGGELSFFGMFASFDTPFEVTTSELAIELLFPADRVTAELLRTCAPANAALRKRGEAE